MRYRNFAAATAMLVCLGVTAGWASFPDDPVDGDRPRPREGGPRDGGPREGGPRDGGPREGGPRDGGPRDGGPRDGGPRDGGPRDGGPREGGPREGGPRDGGPRDGGPEGRRMPPIPVLDALDVNGDGQLDAAEIARAAESLKTLDRDQDGMLSFAEMMPKFRGDPNRGPEGRGGPDGPRDRGDRPEMRGDRDRPEGDQPPRRREGEGNNRGGSPEEVAQRVLKLDRDGDGKLSSEELPERMRAIMKRADADGDGMLSKDEILKMVQRRGQEGGAEGRRRSEGGATEGGERPRRPPAE